MLEDDETNGTQTLELCVVNAFNIRRIFNVSVLRNRSVTFTSSSSLFFRFRGHDLHLASGITFHFRLRYGSVVEDLPVVRLTDTVSYVTSPWFNRLNRFYPSEYEGKFHPNLSKDQSVFISFTYFLLEPDASCEYDYLDFRVKEMDTVEHFTWRRCGEQDIYHRGCIAPLYHSSSTLTRSISSLGSR